MGASCSIQAQARRKTTNRFTSHTREELKRSGQHKMGAWNAVGALAFMASPAPEDTLHTVNFYTSFDMCIDLLLRFTATLKAITAVLEPHATVCGCMEVR